MSAARGSAGTAVLALCALALLAGVASAASEGEIVAAGKQLSVRRLDHTLRDATLAAWIHDLAGKHAVVTWEANDCGEACGCPADSARDLPICAEVDATLANGTLARVLVTLGTRERGIAGEPGLSFAEIVTRDHTRHTMASLSALATALARSRR